jgi:hypothetical protein
VPQKTKLELLSNSIDGQRFVTDFGTNFRVLKGEYFSQESIGNSNKKYLNNLRQGLLVSVSFYGRPVSLITVSGGVVRLDEVNVEGVDLKTATAISQALKNTETRQPIGLYRIT